MSAAPGAYRPAKDRWGAFKTFASELRGPAVAVVDARVAKLHGKALKALAGHEVIAVRAGEGVKTLRALASVAASASNLPRSGTLVAVGGGSVGDLATVAAHLIKRGVRLVQVPTTLLAAVDSSLGGKGAVHVKKGRHTLKNALGVFHYADETWLCPEFFDTLKPRQRTEGAIEAWKMFATLDARRFESFQGTDQDLIRAARELKEHVCREDPYELAGARRVLNFGHTLGHVIESVTRFKVSHGEAVGLGMLCALDVGVETGVTSRDVADHVERRLRERAGIGERKALARALRNSSERDVLALLRGDKKVGAAGELNFVLVDRAGSAKVQPVEARVVAQLFVERWKAGK